MEAVTDFLFLGSKITADSDYSHKIKRYLLAAQTIKNLPAMQGTQVQSLSWEDPLEKKMAMHSNNLAWRIPWTEEPGRLHPVHGVADSDTTEGLTHFAPWKKSYDKPRQYI